MRALTNHSANRVAEIKLEEVTSTAALDQLQPEWARLCQRCSSATPFQSPDWLISWWKYFGFGDLWVLALRSEDRLVGLAPFFIHPNQDRPWQRQVSLIGVGITDYLDLILDDNFSEPAADLIMRYLARERSRWDLCDFQELRQCSPLLSTLSGENGPGLGTKIVNGQPCPVLLLPDSYEQFLSSLSAKHRRDVRRTRRLLENESEASIETATRESLPEIMEALFRLHRARWRQRNLPGVLDLPQVRDFHRDVAARFFDAGCLRLYALRCNGNIGAVLYTLTGHGTMYSYLDGFDPDLARMSPGTTLIGCAIEDAIRRGLAQFDFMRGAEPFKYTWGAKDRHNLQLVIWH